MLNWFKAWGSSETNEPFVPPPVPKERNYATPESVLPPGLPSTIPEGWVLTQPFPRPKRSDLERFNGLLYESTLDTFHSQQMNLWETLETERRTRVFHENVAKGETLLAEEVLAYEQARVAARDFDPQPKILLYPAGVFIAYGEHEFPQKYVQSIRITEVGHRPYLNAEPPRCRRYRWEHDVGVVGIVRGDAKIEVTLGSGHDFVYTCSRWEVDKLHDALTNAWKHGVPTDQP